MSSGPRTRPGEIRGNALRDPSLAGKIVTLSWDEWGPMKDSCNERNGPEFDLLIDDAATVAADPDHIDPETVYAELAVPASLMN